MPDECLIKGMRRILMMLHVNKDMKKFRFSKIAIVNAAAKHIRRLLQKVALIDNKGVSRELWRCRKKEGDRLPSTDKFTGVREQFAQGRQNPI